MSVLDAVPLQRITAEARQVHAGRLFLTVLAGLLFGVGWMAAKTVGAVWLALVWCAVAVKVGWLEARRPGGARGPAR